MSEVIASLSPSPIRRMFGVAVMGMLGVLLAWLAASTDATPIWRALLLAFGGVALWGALRLWRATEHGIELTSTELRDTAGTQLAELDQIVGIDRGTFAFKPSNGFVLKLATRHDRGWAPGLWWRTSRRIGVGGVTHAGEAKFMAEVLAATLAARRPDP